MNRRIALTMLVVLAACADEAASPREDGGSGGAPGGAGGVGGDGGDGGAPPSGGSGGFPTVPDCVTAADCEDHVACTTDACADGACTHVADSSACEAGSLCHATDGCRPAEGWLCRACEADADCLREGDVCASFGEARACVPACGSELACPVGFSCADFTLAGGATARACGPIGGLCCLDPDGDGAGVGCGAFDCDEDAPEVRAGAPERCNGVDDDCDGTVDGRTVDCPAPSCGPTAEGFATIASVCVEASCVEATPRSCGEAACAPLEGGGSDCAARCIDASGCRAGASCDPVLQLCVGAGADGARCLDESDCASGHCEAGVCCAAGESCCPMPGMEQRESCGPFCGLGDRVRACTTSFTWGPYGACETTRLCEPGAVQQCNPCGTQNCSPCGRWEACIDGPDDGVLKERGQRWENAEAEVMEGTISTPYGWDRYTAGFADNYWYTMQPYASLTFSYGEAYLLGVKWKLDRIGTWTREPLQSTYCETPGGCTLRVNLATPDVALDLNDDAISLEVVIHRMSDRATPTCDLYTLTIDA